MLRISDRYIIRSFLISFAICCASLVSLYIIIDTFANLSNLVDRWRESGESAGWFVMTILEMNFALLPVVFYELTPVLTLSAGMFTVVSLKRSNELIPLLASGVSIYRILWPIFLMALVLTGLQIADKEILIPKYGDSIYNWIRLREDRYRLGRNLVIVDDGYGNHVYAGRYRIPDRTQVYPRLTRYWKDTAGRRQMVILNGEKAFWSDAPPGWRYVNGSRIEYDREGNVLRQTAFGEDGFFVPFARGLKEPASFALVTDVRPVQLETSQVRIPFRPTLRLLEDIHQHGMRANVAFEINRRMAGPLANIVLLLIGLPFVLKREMKSPFLAMIAAVFIAGAYLSAGVICENLALGGTFLSPLAGAWAPIIIFGPIGALIFDTVES